MNKHGVSPHTQSANVADLPDEATNNQSNLLFALSDKLRSLRAEKDDFTAMMKEINGEIEDVSRQLTDAMMDAECTSFTRGDRQFIITTTTRWSAEPDRKQELYDALRTNGYEHLFTVNAQTLSAFVRELMENAQDAGDQLPSVGTFDGNVCRDTRPPDWISGLVKSYDDVGITIKKSKR